MASRKQANFLLSEEVVEELRRSETAAQPAAAPPAVPGCFEVVMAEEAFRLLEAIH